MSLINDALKQAGKSRQPDQPSTPSPLRPVEPALPGATRWLLPLAVVALAVAAAFFIGLSLAGRKSPPPENAPKISAAQPAPSAPPAPEAARATNAPETSNVVAAVLPPGPKLQAVFYGQKSWAIVDGKSVYAGDRVRDLRVLEISRNSVTLENLDGSRQRLALGE